jgi:hypothetical protein
MSVPFHDQMSPQYKSMVGFALGNVKRSVAGGVAGAHVMGMINMGRSLISSSSGA